MHGEARFRGWVKCLAAAGLAGVLSGGCSRSGPEPPPATAQQPATGEQPTVPSSVEPPLVDSKGRMTSMASDGGVRPQTDLTWTAPAGWVSETPSSSMRKAQYSLPGAPGDSGEGQCAIFYFGPGQGGDVQANVSRWASQFTDSSGNHPTPSVTEGTIAGMKVLKVTLEGTYTPSPMMGGDLTPKPDSLLLGAIAEGPDSNWFFKCTGPRKTLEAHRKEFDALIDSLHLR